MKGIASRPFVRFLLFLYGTVIAALFVISMAITKGDEVLWLNGGHTPFLDRFFSLTTHFGEGWIFLPFVVAALFIRFSYSVMGVAISIFHGIINTILKRLVFPNFLRPIGVMDNSLLYFVPGIEVHTNYSFPSGHTATIFAAMVFASLLVRRRLASVFFLLFALTVASSRIYLLQHFLIDVAGGALVGSSAAFIVWYVFERIHAPAWMNQFLNIKMTLSHPGSIKINLEDEK